MRPTCHCDRPRSPTLQHPCHAVGKTDLAILNGKNGERCMFSGRILLPAELLRAAGRRILRHSASMLCLAPCLRRTSSINRRQNAYRHLTYLKQLNSSKGVRSSPAYPNALIRLGISQHLPLSRRALAPVFEAHDLRRRFHWPLDMQRDQFPSAVALSGNWAKPGLARLAPSGLVFGIKPCLAFPVELHVIRPAEL